MKKRTIIAIIITAIIVFITNKFWFFIRPLPVNFDILGHGNCNIEVQLNKKDNNEFKKVKSKSVQVNLDEKKHVDIPVNRAKYPKRIKIILSDLSSDTPITIRNIQFRDGRFTLDNIEKFQVDGADVINKDNNLILIPNSDTITLTYPDTLHVRARMDFDFMVFGIILILTFLLAYKLSDYVAEFNTTKGKSRVEIIFLTIFFVFLFVPMSHINKDEISLQQNKTLAKWRPLIADDNTINFEFGKNFNEWFNDRFGFSEFFVNIYTNIKYHITYCYYEKNDYYLNKKNHYMSDKRVTNKTEIYSAETIENIIKNVNRLQKFCQSNNMKCYILIAPAKDTIPNTSSYPINRITSSNNYYKDTKRVIDIIYNKTGQKIIYPYEDIVSLSKNSNAHFKTDQHWTDESAYIGYLHLMNEIKKDYKNINISKLNDFNFIYSNKVRVSPNRYFDGQVYNFTGINDESLFDTKYKYFLYKSSDKIIATSEDYTPLAYALFNYENTINSQSPDMVLYGDSTTLNMLPVITGSFHFVNNIYTWVPDGESPKNYLNISKFEKYILEDKPDIFVLCSFDLSRLEYIWEVQ